MGAVIRSTCLLPAIKRAYPKSFVTWLTLKQSKAMLLENPYIDRLLSVDDSTSALLARLDFDILYAVDKSIEAGAFAELVHARHSFGFGLNAHCQIRPLNPEASYQFDVGLDDKLKFFINQKPETQQITETMALPWVRDPYILAFTSEEKARIDEYRLAFKKGAQGIIGYNTGCSELFPYKKFRIEKAIETIRQWRKTFPNHSVALLGGPQDKERHAILAETFAGDELVIPTDLTSGLRVGILQMAAVDMVFSGCSLGMHLAIALHSRCSHLASFDGRMQQAATSLGLSPALK
jgi:heptosyltransferase-2